MSLVLIVITTNNRTGLLDCPEKAWSQDGGNESVCS